MMKYILCILFSILLAGAGGSKFVSITSNQQESQLKTGVVNNYNKSDAYILKSVNAHDPINRNYNDSNANYNVKDVILCNVFISQCKTPSKILKFNATHLVMHLLSSLDSPLPDNEWKKHSSVSNFIRYSNGYYVYTLGHILI